MRNGGGEGRSGHILTITDEIIDGMFLSINPSTNLLV